MKAIKAGKAEAAKAKFATETSPKGGATPLPSYNELVAWSPEAAKKTRGAFNSRAYDSMKRQCLRLHIAPKKAQQHASAAYVEAARANALRVSTSRVWCCKLGVLNRGEFECDRPWGYVR